MVKLQIIIFTLTTSAVFAQDKLKTKDIYEGQSHGNDFSLLSTRTNLQTPSITDAKYYVHFAAAAYCQKSLASWTCPQCLLTGPNTKLHSIITNGENLGYIVTNHIKKEIVLTFRGSKYAENWWNNIDILQISSPFNNAVKLHKGFHTSAMAIYSQVLAKVKDLHKLYPNYIIVVVGHSLGGAMASITLYYLSHQLPGAKYSLFTYGQPRTGNRKFAEWMNSQRIPAARVVNQGDMVPQVLWLDILNYDHHHIEFWTWLGVTKICRKDVYEDPSCSLSVPVILWNWIDHLWYFGNYFSPYLCL